MIQPTNVKRVVPPVLQSKVLPQNQTKQNTHGYVNLHWLRPLISRPTGFTRGCSTNTVDINLFIHEVCLLFLNSATHSKQK